LSIKLWDAHTHQWLRTFGPGPDVGHVRAIAFSPDSQTLAAAAEETTVTLWDVRTGNLQRTLTGHVNWVHAVRFSPDGRRISSGSDDQTIKIWNAADGRLLTTLLTLPPTLPDQPATDWLAVTPEGYYDGSPGAARFIQWRLGNDLFPVEAFEETFHRPELVQQVLAGAPLPATPQTQQFAQGRSIPPQVTILRPREGQEVTGDTLRVELTVTDDREGLRVELFVNNRPVEIELRVNRPKPIPAGAKPIDLGAKPYPAAHRVEQKFLATVPLFPGESQITLKAVVHDAEALQGSEEIRLTRPLAAAALGDLHVLAVGVSEYRDARYNLKYAAKDAAAFADLWQRRTGPLYRRVVPHQLTDADATAEKVQAALLRLIDAAQPGDSVALFLSGHGLQDGAGDFYFATHDTDAGAPARVEETALRWSFFQTTLRSLQAKQVFLFLDACHSGSALGERQASSERLAEALAKRAGVLVFASSRGGEFSYEADTREHGAFTAALLDGIGEGQADLVIEGERDGRITAAELLAYLQDRVPRLTGNRQTPTAPLILGFSDAPVARVR
jgi:hypothetical protein